MRIITKGGVWKNTEDEILKAAVMKYGKNQWARISSLLVRKSAKQCKARWYEWLDPAIKKTEWSREEDEKLLHLAKIMPNQWKTIAPIVGRTASQCIEHYEKLLDAAQNKVAASATSEDTEPAEDPRRLRPGEIDPNPESKPARPDPVDMDEDEKEMLSEARARLANTKGKKAKRKAREKQLEEARRLAALQKRRELKAAGIELPRARRKIKGIDYNNEIPFQKKPPPGVYAVDFSNEKKMEPLKPGGVSIDQLEGKRKREEEDDERQTDVKRQKKRSENDMPKFVETIAKLNEAQQQRARSKLILPSPQLSDQELEEIAKLSSQGATLPDEEVGNEATRALLPDLGPTPLPLPVGMRTPLPIRTPLRLDSVRREAENLVALNEAPTPLHGGENPALHPSDFSGATPRPVTAATPNILATPLRLQQGAQTPGRGGEATNASALVPAKVGGKVGQTPLRTPLRDQLRINEEQAFEDQLQAKRLQQGQRKSLLTSLKSLPAPQNEQFNIELPELPEEAFLEAEDDLERDASDIVKERLRMQREEEERQLRLRSQVLKRHLPRPVSQIVYSKAFQPRQTKPELRNAEELIRQEVIKYLIHDASEVPFKESKIKGRVHDWDDLEETVLQQADRLLQEETERLVPEGLSPEAFDQVWRKNDADWIYVPSQNKYVQVSATSKKEYVEGLSALHQLARTYMEQDATRASRIETKSNVYFGGYQKRSEFLKTQIQALLDQVEQASTELECFKRLQEIESYAMPNRIETIRKDLEIQEQREQSLQSRYRDLQLELQS